VSAVGASLRARVAVVPRAWWLALVGLVALCAVRVLTDANELTSPGTFRSALTLAVPLALAALGGVLCERAGIINIGLEGMMILGTWFGAWATWRTGDPWLGALLGLAGGAAGGLIHAVATVTFGVDQIISGLSVNIIAAGVARYLTVISYGGGSGGGATQSPLINAPTSFDVPVISGGDLFGWHSPDVAGSLAQHHWFLISDVAGFVAGMTSEVSWMTPVVLLAFPLAAFMLWRTRLGLRLRSCGENPLAADSLGVRVYHVKYLAVILSGALAGLAGAYLATVATGLYAEGQTAGRGYIALAIVIFGNWRIGGAAAGAALFGYVNALQLRATGSFHSVLLLAAVLLAVVGVWIVVRWLSAKAGGAAAGGGAASDAAAPGDGSTAAAGDAAGGAAAGAAARSRRAPAGALGWLGAALGVGVLYALIDAVPQELIPYTPYLVTLVVLAFASQRLRPPAADGQPYIRGEAR
jgi:ABC-type uncharacterized transport system permease subunit